MATPTVATPIGATPTGAAPLSAEALAAYRRDGYLLLPPEFLAGDVLDAAAAAVPAALAQDSDRRIMERDEVTVRSVYGVHRHVPEIARLARLPQLLGAVRQLLGGDVYVHQSKVNVKAPFGGDQWEWHQDYIYWLQDDGLARPQLVNAAIFLDDVTEFNGPLTFVRGSHAEGVLAAVAADGMPLGYEDAPSWVATLTAEEKFRVEPATIAALARERGMVSPKGPAGSVLFFDPNLLHASAANISPFRRGLTMFVYNSVDNLPGPVSQPRPTFLADPDTTALQPL